jgi:hypothetical protein
MAIISSETQILIDRLHALDPELPQLDPPRVEDAFQRSIANFGMRARPVRQLPDASTAYRYMIELAVNASRPEATCAAEEAARATRTRKALAASNAAHGRALEISQQVCGSELEEPSRLAHEAAEGAAGAVEILAGVREAARQRALQTPFVTILLEAKFAARDGIWQAAGDCAKDPIWIAAYHIITDDLGGLTAAISACEHRNALSIFDNPAERRLADAWLPMVDAFEAGLFFYWITPSEVLWVPRPALSVVDGHLHREDGPAVEWPSGERHFFWHGTCVPDWVIEDPSRITADALRAEKNEHVRRCMMERIGRENAIIGRRSPLHALARLIRRLA